MQQELPNLAELHRDALRQLGRDEGGGGGRAAGSLPDPPMASLASLPLTVAAHADGAALLAELDTARQRLCLALLLPSLPLPSRRQRLCFAFLLPSRRLRRCLSLWPSGVGGGDGEARGRRGGALHPTGGRARSGERPAVSH